MVDYHLNVWGWFSCVWAVWLFHRYCYRLYVFGTLTQLRDLSITRYGTYPVFTLLAALALKEEKITLQIAGV
ncbi:MAG: hypothetical protein Ct9H300mP14_15290 [Gammaproteobacteria bacterium]|nr:MAG: hypothetical protein Ct9H300mP14_15290 [Gammaproteobacteria bacterium]